MNKKIIIGLFIIFMGILCNEWLLISLISPDGDISLSSRNMIRGFNVSCIFLGILIIRYRQYDIRKFKLSGFKGVVIYCVLLVVFSFAFCEAFFRILKYAPYKTWNVSVAVKPNGKFFMKHPKLGYTHLPGKYEVTFRHTGYMFNVTNLDNTLRITHPLSTYPSNRENEIWILGGSYTQGWSINDEETYPWIVQEKLSNYEVVNFGVGGYGTLHSLIQLQEALKERNKPELVVLTYASFHDARNTFSRSRRKTVATYNRLGPLIQPYVRLDKKGILHYFMADVVYEEFPLASYSAFIHWLEDKYNILEEKRYRIREVSKMLIKDIAQLCSQNDIEFILAGISPDYRTLEMLEYFENSGMKVTDVSVEQNEKTMNLPHDGHPSPFAHKQIGQKLIRYLSGLGFNNPKDSDKLQIH